MEVGRRALVGDTSAKETRHAVAGGGKHSGRSTVVDARDQGREGGGVTCVRGILHKAHKTT